MSIKYTNQKYNNHIEMKKDIKAKTQKTNT